MRFQSIKGLGPRTEPLGTPDSIVVKSAEKRVRVI